MSDPLKAGWVSPIYPKERLVLFLADGRHVEVTEGRAWACIRACVGIETRELERLAPGAIANAFERWGI